MENSVSSSFNPNTFQMRSQATDTTSLSSAQASEFEDAESGELYISFSAVCQNSFYFYKYFAGTKPFNSFSSCTLYIFLLVINILTWYMVQHMITKQVPGYNLFSNYYSLRLRRSMLDSLMHSIQCRFQVNFFPYISKSVRLNG